MQISDFGLELVKAFEGFFPKPYFCPAGVRTQGFGHTAAAGAPALGGVWAREYASGVLLRTITARYAAPVEKMLKRKPTQGQFDAMVSLAYNIGVDSFGGSSVLRNFNAGNDAAAVASFALWNKAAGKVMPGLVRRRASEALAYQGFQDVNFDGKRQPSGPIYGPMPRAVEAADAPPLISGGGSSGGAGVAITAGAFTTIGNAMNYSYADITAGFSVNVATNVTHWLPAGHRVDFNFALTNGASRIRAQDFGVHVIYLGR